jgi:chromate transporter
MAAGSPPSLGTIVREWGRIGCVGFGGPPAHIAMLRELCVSGRGWLSAEDFEHGVAACNLLPGPASTQLSIFCAWRLRGAAGAILGGLAFITPGLLAIVALAALFLGAPPNFVRGAGAGAAAIVPAVAVQAAAGLIAGGRETASGAARRRRLAYVAVGVAGTVALGPWVVLALVGCGAVELLLAREAGSRAAAVALPWPLAAAMTGGLGALAFTALKVGALSFGGGFVIVPLMQGDAVGVHHWMSHSEFLNAVALGQATPGPVTHTVAVVGYAAAGVGGALLAAVVAFAPSFAFVLAGAPRFDFLRAARGPRAFLAGAGPAAIGAILGSAVLLAGELSEPWQGVVLAAGAVALALGRGLVPVLLAAAAAGAIAAALGAPLPQ